MICCGCAHGPGTGSAREKRQKSLDCQPISSARECTSFRRESEENKELREVSVWPTLSWRVLFLVFPLFFGNRVRFHKPKDEKKEPFHHHSVKSPQSPFLPLSQTRNTIPTTQSFDGMGFKAARTAAQPLQRQGQPWHRLSVQPHQQAERRCPQTHHGSCQPHQCHEEQEDQ